MWILEFLGIKSSEAAPSPDAETESVRKIVDALDRLEPERARFIAAFAYVMSRVANADLDISVEETRSMERIVMESMELSEAQAVLTVQIAKTQSKLFGGTEDFLVTREFERLATAGQKRALLKCLFAVAAADENISTVENNEVRKIAAELKLGQDDLIGARSAYVQHLAVLKKSSDP